MISSFFLLLQELFHISLGLGTPAATSTGGFGLGTTAATSTAAAPTAGFSFATPGKEWCDFYLNL